MKEFNLALRFVLELCGLAAAAYWGFTVLDGFGRLLGLAAPVAVGFAWGTLVAPKARIRLAYNWKLLLGVLILSFCGLALIHAGRASLGLTYILIVVLNAAATRAWGQPLDGRPPDEQPPRDQPPREQPPRDEQPPTV